MYRFVLQVNTIYHIRVVLGGTWAAIRASTRFESHIFEAPYFWQVLVTKMNGQSQHFDWHAR